MSELSAKETLEQMIAGTHEDPIDESVNDESTEEQEVEETETDVKNEDTTTEDASVSKETETDDDNEDTDQETESEEEEDTIEENDDSVQETLETDDKAQEEDTHNETEESENANVEQTDEINYKEFYEKVALAKFTANGKEVEGFKDPEDLIRAQQMLHGYSDKMKVFKEYKKFLKPLEERGVTQDPDKFNLAMSLLDGDPEALKKVLKEKQIDPLDLDLEDIKYTPKSVLPSDAQLLIEETYEQADNLGIGDRFNKVISKDWDVPSLQEFINNGAVRNDLITHLKDGTYDLVQNEIARMEILDSTGALNGMNSIEKYRAAVSRLNQRAQQESMRSAPKVEPTTPAVDRIAEAEKAKQETEFKKKAEAKEKEIAEARKKAASVSKPKKVSKSKPTPKLEELKGDEFRNAFRDMLMN